jgi:signal transduction histidine kinase
MKTNEKEILNIIKYLPVFLTLLISGILTFYLYFQNIEKFEKESKILESRYININKELIKFQIVKIKQNIIIEKNNQILKLKKELKEQVENAYSIAFSIYKNNLNKNEEEVTKLIKDALREIRFNQKRGYLFVYSRNGKNILHPIKTHLENKNLWNYQDKKGTFLIQEMNKILEKKDSTYYSWYWTKPEDNTEELKKQGYFKLFEPFNWFIGTGEYLKDFDMELKRQLSLRLSEYRYKKDGYIFVLDYDGNYISYHDKKYIGKNIRDFPFSDKATKLVDEMVNITKIKADFIQYKHDDKPKNIGEIEKISYVDGIKDWKWILGTGFYMDDFYNEIKIKKEELSQTNTEELQKLLIISFCLTLILLSILIYISKILESKFVKYTIEIENQINENIKKDSILSHQSKMAAMGEMIGNIAHQWRQPLSTISTITTGMKIQREMGIKDETLENNAMDRINKHVQYLSQTIDDFRDFFKPNKEASVFEIDKLFRKVFDLIEVQYLNKNIVFIKEINNIPLCSLENELLQVLINIFNNARDALENCKSQKYIFINTKINNNDLIISIKDNGMGIDKTIIQRIFEPYFTTKDKSQGTGIGLFMSEQIVVKHLKGSINVSNVKYEYKGNKYEGALFEIVLPLKINK